MKTQANHTYPENRASVAGHVTPWWSGYLCSLKSSFTCAFLSPVPEQIQHKRGTPWSKERLNDQVAKWLKRRVRRKKCLPVISVSLRKFFPVCCLRLCRSGFRHTLELFVFRRWQSQSLQQIFDYHSQTVHRRVNSCGGRREDPGASDLNPTETFNSMPCSEKNAKNGIIGTWNFIPNPKANFQFQSFFHSSCFVGHSPAVQMPALLADMFNVVPFIIAGCNQFESVHHLTIICFQWHIDLAEGGMTFRFIFCDAHWSAPHDVWSRKSAIGQTWSQGTNKEGITIHEPEGNQIRGSNIFPRSCFGNGIGNARRQIDEKRGNSLLSQRKTQFGITWCSTCRCFRRIWQLICQLDGGRYVTWFILLPGQPFLYILTIQSSDVFNFWDLFLLKHCLCIPTRGTC